MSKAALLKAIFFFGLFLLGMRETLDPDLWWHLKTGESILLHGIPRVDPFSYTVAGQPWVAHEWLSEIILFQIYKLGHFNGLMLFFAALLPLSFYGIYRRMPGAALLILVPVGLLGATMVSFFWGARPQVFNVVWLSFFLWLLEAVQLKRVRFYWIGLLLPALILWSNLHSGFVLGFVLMGCFWLAQGLEARFPRSEKHFSNKERSLFLFFALVCLGVMELSPHGREIISYPFLTLGNATQQSFIAEWQSPNFHLGLFQFFLLFIFLSLVSLILNPQKISWFEMIVYIGSFGAALISVRHIPFFIIVSVPIICKSLQGFFSGAGILFSAEGGSTRLRKINLLLFTLIALACFFCARAELKENLRKVDSHELATTVDFLKEKGWDALRGFNAYDWGGYLIWRGVRVFIDGRADLYQDHVLKDYITITDIGAMWDHLLKSYKIDYILFRKGTPLSNILLKQEMWEVAQQSEKVILFRKSEGLKGD